MIKNTLIIFLCLQTLAGFPQEIVNPDFTFKSHPTLKIMKIIRNEKGTYLLMRITSQKPEATFCVDPNTVILLADNTKLPLEETVNIPRCPEEHTFHKPGEALPFVLRFPSLPGGTLSVDVVENCEHDCLSIIGLITDPDLNTVLHTAHNAWATGDPEKALQSYQAVLQKIKGKNLSLETGLYSYIIQIWNEGGNNSMVKEWIRKLKSEKPPYYEKLVADLEKAGMK